MKFFPAAAFVFAVTVAQAAPLQRDIGENLVYFRAHGLPADLPSADATRRRACILDLRYAQGDEQAAVALAAWLKFHASAHTPVFVLANAETSRDLLATIADHDTMAGVLTIGLTSHAFKPDVAVPGTPANERRAYDALEHGTPLAALLTDNPDKARNDEASLAKDRPAESAAADETIDAAKNHSPAPPIDATLQRAVHLHRALIALRKI